jgi:hypothetical protein
MFPNEARRWIAENVGVPVIDFDADGRRVATQAPDVISVRREWCDTHYGLSAMWQADGTLWLDTAGVHRYRYVRALLDGADAYEKIPA